jgi:hypothetical protein
MKINVHNLNTVGRVSRRCHFFREMFRFVESVLELARGQAIRLHDLTRSSVFIILADWYNA